MLQWLGALALLGSAGYVSLSFGTWEKKGIAQTEGFLQLVRYMREQIACFYTPTPQILMTFENEDLHACGFLPAARAGGFAAGLAAARPHLCLTPDVTETLSRLENEIGKGYAAAQITLCDYVAGQLEKQLKRQKEEAPKRTRVLRTLTCVGSLMLVVLLL